MCRDYTILYKNRFVIYGHNAASKQNKTASAPWSRGWGLGQGGQAAHGLGVRLGGPWSGGLGQEAQGIHGLAGWVRWCMVWEGVGLGGHAVNHGIGMGAWLVLLHYVNVPHPTL